MATRSSARATRRRQHVDLAIIDLTLPRQAGSEHFDDAAARGLLVILISAYPDRINRPPAGYPFLAKPFVGRKLIELLERVLQGSPQTSTDDNRFDRHRPVGPHPALRHEDCVKTHLVRWERINRLESRVGLATGRSEAAIRLADEKEQVRMARR